MVKIHHFNCVKIDSPLYGKAIGHCLLLEGSDNLVLIDVSMNKIREFIEKHPEVDVFGFHNIEEFPIAINA